MVSNKNWITFTCPKISVKNFTNFLRLFLIFLQKTLDKNKNKEYNTNINKHKHKHKHRKEGFCDMFNEYEIKKEICEIGRRIYVNGFVAANDGNITVKVSDNVFFATPTGVSKGYMTPDMIIKVDGTGKVLDGKMKPSSELKMHLRVYKERPDVCSVVHAHPPTATGFAIAGIPLDKFTMPEAIIYLGTVPLTEYGTPSTDEIPDSLSKYLQNYDAFLLENHGALTVGNTLLNAYFKMETLEFYAKISLVARQLGGEQELTCEQIDKLMQIRESFKVPGKHPGCNKCAKRGTPECKQAKSQAESCDETLVAEITKKVLLAINK
jgi:L-fuculose-phosphate aldolase